MITDARDEENILRAGAHPHRNPWALRQSKTRDGGHFSLRQRPPARTALIVRILGAAAIALVVASIGFAMDLPGKISKIDFSRLGITRHQAASKSGRAVEAERDRKRARLQKSRVKGPVDTQTTTTTEPPPVVELAKGEKLIVVSKRRQQVFLYEASSKPLASFTASTGKSWPATGTFRVYSKSPKSSSPKYGVYFNNMVRFWKPRNSAAVGFHSLTYDRKGRVIDADKLGQPVSHGCVRLSFENADFLYKWAPIGTKVVVID